MASRWIDTRDPEKRKDLVRLAERLISEAIQGRRNSGVLERAQKFDRYYFGEHKIKGRHKSKGNSVRNKAAEIVENRIANLTDNPPKWFFRAQEEGDLFTSEALNQVLGDIVWERIEWDDRGEESILEACASGTSHIKTLVDVNTGFPDYEVIPIQSFAKDPHAKKKSQLSYWIHFTVSSVEQIRQKYGVELAGEEFDDGSQSATGLDNPEISYTANSNHTAPNVWNLLHSGFNREEKTVTHFQRVIIAEIWMEDLTQVSIPFKVTETNEEHAQMAAGRLVRPEITQHHVKHIEEHEKLLEAIRDDETKAGLITLLERHIEDHKRFPGYEKTQQRKYPRGRILTVSQGKLLRDQANPLPMDFRDVVIKWDNVKLRNTYYGKPLMHDLYDMQDDLNHRNNSITQNINMLNNGVRTIKKSAGLKNWSKIGNLVGLNIPVGQHDDFKATFGPPLPPQFYQDKYALEADMERQSGNNEIQQGRYPTGSPAGTTIAQLDEKGSARPRAALRHYAGALKQMARNAIAIMSEFMDEDEVFRITNDENIAQNVRWGDLKKSKGLYDIRVDVVSMESTTRARKLREALELYQAGVYDDQAILEVIDDPRKYGVLQRKSLILQLQQALEGAQIENEALKKELNTAINRLQTAGGDGNVGAFQTAS